MKRIRFAPPTQLALDPRAFGQTFPVLSAIDKGVMPVDGEISVIPVTGPLVHHEEWLMWRSYETIKNQVAAALDSDSRAVVLNFDSPGGMVSGLFECVRDLRRLADKSGKPLVAYVNGSATSACYALAVACDRIVAAPESVIGSIGVIDCLVDETAADEEAGFKFTIVKSGARKDDGNAHSKTTEAAVEATQDMVNALADSFFSLVAERRPTLTVDAVRDLQAAVMTGKRAKDFGLVDETGSLDSLLAELASDLNVASATITNSGETPMLKSTSKEDMLAKLRKMADDGDEKAKKALKAFDEDDDKESKAEDEKEEGAKAEDKEEEAKAEDKDEEARAEDKDEEAKAASTAAAVVDGEDLVAVVKDLQAFKTQALRKEEAQARSELITSRPDLSDKVAAWLSKQPLANVKDFIGSLEPLPEGQSPVANARAALGVQPTAGDAKNRGSRLDPAAKRALDRQMGLLSPSAGAEFDGVRFTFGSGQPAKDDK
jgi:capsid assembly protease